MAGPTLRIWLWFPKLIKGLKAPAAIGPVYTQHLRLHADSHLVLQTWYSASPLADLSSLGPVQAPWLPAGPCLHQTPSRHSLSTRRDAG